MSAGQAEYTYKARRDGTGYHAWLGVDGAPVARDEYPGGLTLTKPAGQDEIHMVMQGPFVHLMQTRMKRMPSITPTVRATLRVEGALRSHWMVWMLTSWRRALSGRRFATAGHRYTMRVQVDAWADRRTMDEAQAVARAGAGMMCEEEVRQRLYQPGAMIAHSEANHIGAKHGIRFATSPHFLSAPTKWKGGTVWTTSTVRPYELPGNDLARALLDNTEVLEWREVEGSWGDSWSWVPLIGWDESIDGRWRALMTAHLPAQAAALSLDALDQAVAVRQGGGLGPVDFDLIIGGSDKGASVHHPANEQGTE